VPDLDLASLPKSKAAEALGVAASSAKTLFYGKHLRGPGASVY
jgi:hypothetical protein